MRVLITGGCGFVGRAFANHHLQKGDDVTVVDSLVDGSGAISPQNQIPCPWDYGKYDHIYLDCRDFFTGVDGYLDFDLVYHLAAIVGGRKQIEEGPLVVAEDLAIDVAFWQWIFKKQKHNQLVPQIVYFSSSAAYPVVFQHEMADSLSEEDQLISDNSVWMPDDIYGWVKLTGERLAHTAWERHGIRSAVYRPFSGYGSDQDDNYPFPSIVKRAMGASKQRADVMTVWGSGTQVRDWIHIDDIVRMVDFSTERLLLNYPAKAMNLSTGIGTSMIDLANLVLHEIDDPEISVYGNTAMPAGVHTRIGNTRFQRLIGVSHEIELIDGIRRAIHDYKGHS